jgi:transcriptional regulator with XRE-family HTH domain
MTEEELNKLSQEELLKKQAESLTRWVKNHRERYTVIELANKIGARRLSLYQWMRGQVTMPEDKCEKLAKIFGITPAELRYGIQEFNEDDMAFVVSVLVKEMALRDLTLPAEKVGIIATALYNNMQDYKRAMMNNYAKESVERSLKVQIEALVSMQ